MKWGWCYLSKLQKYKCEGILKGWIMNRLIYTIMTNLYIKLNFYYIQTSLNPSKTYFSMKSIRWSSEVHLPHVIFFLISPFFSSGLLSFAFHSVLPWTCKLWHTLAVTTLVPLPSLRLCLACLSLLALPSEEVHELHILLSLHDPSELLLAEESGSWHDEEDGTFSELGDASEFFRFLWHPLLHVSSRYFDTGSLVTGNNQNTLTIRLYTVSAQWWCFLEVKNVCT